MRTLAIAGRVSVCVRDTILGLEGDSIGADSLEAAVSASFVGGSAVKSKPGIGRPTLPREGVSAEFSRFSAPCNDSRALSLAPLGEYVV